MNHLNISIDMPNWFLQILSAWLILAIITSIINSALEIRKMQLKREIARRAKGEK